MKYRIYTLLSLLFIGAALVFSACNKDDDDDNNKPTPLNCDRTIEGSVTLGQSDYTISMKITGSGTYSVSKIEYKDADGILQTLSNPDLPWEKPSHFQVAAERFITIS
ncbi:MAG: hypothetical protein U5Q03_12660 [Bacteroidota bacterium]|nr:hypothetical protein [Bacteroidota bacterium]